jgi:hypothetical protein
MFKTFGFQIKALFNAASLFTGGYAGFLGVFSNTSTTFQDAAGTTPCDDVGEALGLYNNTVNALPDLTQATSSAKPVRGRCPQGGVRNRLLDTDVLATQNVTTPAAQMTISHTGTGTLTLTGTSTAGPLVGAGSLTFTPTAGTLTITVTGSATLAQLETGAVRTAYQRVGTTRADVTEAGKPSIPIPYYGGDDFLTFGVQSFGTASLFADATQRWSAGGAFSTLSATVQSLLAKRGTGAALRQFAVALNSDGTLALQIRNSVANPTYSSGPATYNDGALHTWLLVWDGSALYLYVDNNAGVLITGLGSAAEEAQNIITGAVNEASPANFYSGFSDAFMIDRALTAAEISGWRAASNAYYRGI